MNKKKAPRPKHEVLKPEDISLNKRYAFNFNPLYQPNHGKVNSVREWLGDMNKILYSLYACEIKMYTEISSLGRYHFHGWIEITDKYKFYNHDVRLLVNEGTVVIKNIENESEWEEYVLKQQEWMQAAIINEVYGPMIKFTELFYLTNIDHMNQELFDVTYKPSDKINMLSSI